MTRKEVLLKMFAEQHEAQIDHKMAFLRNPSTERIDPFQIADGLYYVGDKKVCIHLIDTGDGLILIDSGYLGASHLLVDSIWRAGFDPMNIRLIIHTHAHSDHFGASDEFCRMYGAKLAISKADAEAIRSKPHISHIGSRYPLANMPVFDYEIEDGEIIELGNTKIRCVLTPGHTVGVLTLFFNVTYQGKTYLAGLFGGAGINALKLTNMCYNEAPADCPQQMLRSIDMIYNEPVTVHLGNHPGNNCTLQKREQQLKEGGNPFIDETSWHTFLDSLKKSVEKVIADNEKLSKELDASCDD